MGGDRSASGKRSTSSGKILGNFSDSTDGVDDGRAKRQRLDSDDDRDAGPGPAASAPDVDVMDVEEFPGGVEMDAAFYGGPDIIPPYVAGEQPRDVADGARERHSMILGLLDEAAAELPGKSAFIVRAFAVAKFAGPKFGHNENGRGVLKTNDLTDIIALTRLEYGWRVTDVGIFKPRTDGVKAWGHMMELTKDRQKKRVTNWDPKTTEALSFLVPAFNAITAKTWNATAAEEVRQYLCALGTGTEQEATQKQQDTLTQAETAKGEQIMRDKQISHGAGWDKVGGL